MSAIASALRQIDWPRVARQLLIAIALILAAPLLSRIAPDILNKSRSTYVVQGLVFSMGAIALNLLMGYAGQVSLGHAAFVGVGAFTAGVIAGKAGLAFIYVVPIAIVVGAAFALLVGLPALRIRGLYLAITTLAFAEAMVRWGFPKLSGGNVGLHVPPPRAGDFVFSEPADLAAIAMALFLLIWVVDRNIVRSRLGRSLFGIREDENVASSFGIDVSRTKLVAFMISGAVAAVAGTIQSELIVSAQADAYDLRASLTFVIIVVVGGLGSRMGVTIAALFFAILPKLVESLAIWQYAAGAALLVFTIARHPGGIAQALRESAERKRTPDVVEDEDPLLLEIPRVTVQRPSIVLAAETPVLEARDISVRFGGLQALDHAGVVVRRGTIAGLIGPNGAGKTTLFNAISGFQAHDGGTVRFLGRDISRMAPHGRAAMGMGRTFQLIGLASNLTVTENFLLAQHTLADYGALRSIVLDPGARRAERVMRERAREAIEALGFARYADEPVRNLSGGQQRLVELGCALVTGPEVLLLDEPSAGLSPAATESLADRLRSMRDDLGLTILLIEHHIPLVAEVCDEITVLNLGKPLVSGAAHDVIADPAVVGAYLGEDVA